MELSFKIDLSNIDSAEEVLAEVQSLLSAYRAQKEEVLTKRSDPLAVEAAAHQLNMGENAKDVFDTILRLIQEKQETTLQEVANNLTTNVGTVRACLMNGMRTLKKAGKRPPFVSRWEPTRGCVVYTNQDQ